jgi:starvation-inducible outer membrane lipoprotein
MQGRNRAASIGCCLGFVLWGLAGCTSVVPEALRGEVDRGLTYALLAQDPEGYRGRTVVVGGEVLRVRPAGRDLVLTLTERPLSPVDESPMLGRASGGDLVVQVPGAARAEFREGFAITVVGVVLGRESAEDPASPPRLEARHIQLWAVGRARLPAEPMW